MSNPVSDDWNSQDNIQISPSPSCTDASNEISDAIERRRMQNRLAQRNHRKKVRDHISALEARVVENLLLSPVQASLPNPSSSPAWQYSTFIPTIEPSTAAVHQATEQILNFSPDFPEATDQTYTSQSVSQASRLGGCPTCATCGASLRTRPASCPESSSTPSSIGEAISEFHADSPSQFNHLGHFTQFPDATTHSQAVESRANSREIFGMGPHQPSALRPQLPIPQPHSDSEETTFIRQYATHPHPHQQPAWGSAVSPSPRAIPMLTTIPSSHYQHYSPNERYRFHQASPFIVSQPPVMTPGNQPQQSYVLVPISELYPPPSY